MGKNHASQYANFGSLPKIQNILVKKLTLIYLLGKGNQ